MAQPQRSFSHFLVSVDNNTYDFDLDSQEVIREPETDQCTTILIQIPVLGGIIVIKVRLPKNRKNFDVEVFKIKTRISTKRLASTTIRSTISQNNPNKIILCGTSVNEISHTFKMDNADLPFKLLGIVGVDDDNFDVDAEITALTELIYSRLKITTEPK
jgi:hypothetical protein